MTGRWLDGLALHTPRPERVVGVNPYATPVIKGKFSREARAILLLNVTTENLAEREQNEIEHSAAEAAQTVLAPVDVERYMDPPTDTWNTPITCLGMSKGKPSQISGAVLERT